jgi:hypothetical protein
VQAPKPVRDHPNATFVLSTTPVTTLVVWGAMKLGWVMPQAVAAAVATICASALLVFKRGLLSAGSSVWTIGIKGVFRRIWKGNQPPPVT